MPSLEHEAILELFRQRPELAAALLRDVLHIPLPAHNQVRLEAADFADLAPTTYLADLVVLLVGERPVLGIVVEVQLQKDARKLYTWPVYASSLRARLECDVCVLIVTPAASVAAWAAGSIVGGPGFRFTPLVVGPDVIPIVTHEAQARDDVELAILSVLAHGHTEHAPDVARAAWVATDDLASERRLLYSDLILSAISQAARNALGDLMRNGDYQFRSEYFQNLAQKAIKELAAKAASEQALELAQGMAKDIAQGMAKDIAQGMAKDIAQGMAKDIAQGMAKDIAQGMAEDMVAQRLAERAAEDVATGKVVGKIESILELLDARGLSVSPAQEATIRVCRDSAQLRVWLTRAIAVESVDALLAMDAAPR